MSATGERRGAETGHPQAGRQGEAGGRCAPGAPRRFAVVSAYRDRGIPLPQRRTAASAGYDIAAAEDVEVPPRGVALVPTGLKAYMPDGEFLALYIRSSLAVSRGLMLANGTAVIDADYADNPENEGHILIAVYNRTDQPVRVSRGERVAQAVFHTYGVTADDRPGGPRRGGFGSTGA